MPIESQVADKKEDNFQYGNSPFYEISLLSELNFRKRQIGQEFVTNLKLMFNEFDKFFAYKYSLYYSFIKQFKFEDFSDIFFQKEYSEEYKNILLSKGYEEISKSNIEYPIPNRSVKSNLKIPYTIDKIKKEFYINNINFKIFIKDNILFFYKDNEEFISIKFEDNIKLKECYIVDFLFLDIIFTDLNTNKTSLIKTHLSFDFFNYNYENLIITRIEEMERICIVNFDYEFDYILESNLNYLILKNKGEKIRIDFVKKVFFIENSNIYFSIGNKDEFLLYKDTFKYNYEVSEHIFLYEIIDSFGLNFIKDVINFNSFYFEKLLNKKMEFNNTFNGALNLINLENEKDYYINKKMNNFYVTGNFNNDYEKGSYIITVYINDFLNTLNELNVTFYLYKNNKLLKTVKTTTYNRLAFFSNLKFNFYRLYYLKDKESLSFEIADNYNIKFKKINIENNYEKFNIKNIENIPDKLYSATNKDIANHSIFSKKEEISIYLKENNLFLKDFIIDKNNTMFNKDLKLELIKDNKPTNLWKSIKDTDYYIDYNVSNYHIQINIKSEEKEVFKVNVSEFDFKFDKF